MARAPSPAFPLVQAAKTLASATSDFPLLLVVLRAEDRVDFARLAALSGTRECLFDRPRVAPVTLSPRRVNVGPRAVARLGRAAFLLVRGGVEPAEIK